MTTADVIQQLADLRSFGYVSVRRSFGADLVLRSPDGRIVHEAGFGKEIDSLLEKESDG